MMHQSNRHRLFRYAALGASVAIVSGFILTSAGAQDDQVRRDQGASPMTTSANSIFKIAKWDESAYDESEGQPKLTRASVTKLYTGDLEGEGALVMLMTYRLDDTAQFVGLERFTGTLGGRAGSFVLEHTGSFANGIVKSTWTVVPGSGTGELAELTGSITFEAGHAEQFPVSFEYTLE